MRCRYNYFRSGTSQFDIGTWGAEILEAHIVTLFLGLACIPLALAARSGRRPGNGVRALMHGAAVLGSAVLGLTAAGYASSATRSAGPSFYIQALAAIGALALAVMAGRMQPPAADSKVTTAA